MAHVCACTGWTWDYVLDNIDLPRLDALRKQWKEIPPICVMLAGYFGILKKDDSVGDDVVANSPDSFEAKGENIGELLQNLPRDPLVLKGDLSIGTSHLSPEERSKLR